MEVFDATVVNAITGFKPKYTLHPFTVLLSEANKLFQFTKTFHDHV
jgi:hypothetical protein